VDEGSGEVSLGSGMPSVGRNRVEFELNGEVVAVEGPDPRVSLGDYLRGERGLSGLQLSCRQGGCGACTVLLSGVETTHAGSDHRPVNSCLVPLCSVDGKKVTTVEGVGSVKAGLHPIQSAIVEYHGTQCGMCTPGIVKNLHNCHHFSPPSMFRLLET
jgi:xanthine dehydrogenase/oxidase